MKTVNKTNKHTTKKKDMAKKKTVSSGEPPKWAEAYDYCFGLTYKPVTEAFINAFFEDLFKYITSDDDVFTSRAFFPSKRYRCFNILWMGQKMATSKTY